MRQRTSRRAYRALFRSLIALILLACVLAIAPVKQTSAASGSDSMAACNYQYGWCACTIHNSDGGNHNDVHFYTNVQGTNLDDHQSEYVGAGNHTYWKWMEGNRRADQFVWVSWGANDYMTGPCGMLT